MFSPFEIERVNSRACGNNEANGVKVLLDNTVCSQGGADNDPLDKIGVNVVKQHIEAGQYSIKEVGSVCWNFYASFKSFFTQQNCIRVGSANIKSNDHNSFL